MPGAGFASTAQATDQSLRVGAKHGGGWTRESQLARSFWWAAEREETREVLRLAEPCPVGMAYSIIAQALPGPARPPAW